MSTSFTPISALVGGALIGLAATYLLATVGRIAGISGILNTAIDQRGERGWRVAFLVAMVVAAGAWFAWSGAIPRAGFPWTWLVLAGALVGFGTRLGNGCTSGHGICGLARFSRRSLWAVLVFMGAAFVTTYVVRHVAGGLS
ncbi:YeeE/YedE family protein [Lysobacter auxotrophicus]|uniref:YeeE/YedE family protein n=1 Tax=Lysobacter auxotrophicus TaxID=2992573 RepID=A0ABN6UNG9_9GAMM|nr:YeeE/YedE family protein [Lysobacter auxotrophicus]BDU17921.1 YeeE/YedE family protein [Lysobacter auxotrophicus]